MASSTPTMARLSWDVPHLDQVPFFQTAPKMNKIGLPPLNMNAAIGQTIAKMKVAQWTPPQRSFQEHSGCYHAHLRNSHFAELCIGVNHIQADHARESDNQHFFELLNKGSVNLLPGTCENIRGIVVCDVTLEVVMRIYKKDDDDPMMGHQGHGLRGAWPWWHSRHHLFMSEDGDDEDEAQTVLTPSAKRQRELSAVVEPLDAHRKARIRQWVKFCLLQLDKHSDAQKEPIEYFWEALKPRGPVPNVATQIFPTQLGQPSARGSSPRRSAAHEQAQADARRKHLRNMIQQFIEQPLRQEAH